MTTPGYVNLKKNCDEKRNKLNEIISRYNCVNNNPDTDDDPKVTINEAEKLLPLVKEMLEKAKELKEIVDDLKIYDHDEEECHGNCLIWCHVCEKYIYSSLGPSKQPNWYLLECVDCNTKLVSEKGKEQFGLVVGGMNRNKVSQEELDSMADELINILEK